MSTAGGSIFFLYFTKKVFVLNLATDTSQVHFTYFLKRCYGKKVKLYKSQTYRLRYSQIHNRGILKENVFYAVFIGSLELIKHAIRVWYIISSITFSCNSQHCVCCHCVSLLSMLFLIELCGFARELVSIVLVQQ